MKMKRYIRGFLVSIFVMAFLISCGGQAVESEVSASPEDTQPVEQVQEETVADEAQVPTEELAEPETAEESDPQQPEAPIAVELSDLPYTSPSNAFSVYLPENWNCSETGDYRVDCHNADNSAALLVRVIATGYELLQDDFVALAQAEMVSTFENLKAYAEVSQDITDGSVINESTWREGEVYWQGIDRFVSSGSAVYYLRFASVQDNFEAYRNLFNEIIQKVELNETAVTGADLYASRKEYTSRQLIFTIDVPTSWTEFVDVSSIQNTVVSGFISPDKKASIQVAIYSKGSHISQEFKGSKTLEVMRDLYGWDMRANVDKVEPDGRERLEWYGERKGINGITYFDSLNTSIFIISAVWEDSTKNLYKPVLDEILDSFEYYQ